MSDFLHDQHAYYPLHVAMLFCSGASDRDATIVAEGLKMGPELHVLRAGSGTLTHVGIATLLTRPPLSALTVLDVCNCTLGAAGVKTVISALPVRSFLAGA